MDDNKNTETQEQQVTKQPKDTGTDPKKDKQLDGDELVKKLRLKSFNQVSQSRIYQTRIRLKKPKTKRTRKLLLFVLRSLVGITLSRPMKSLRMLA